MQERLTSARLLVARRTGEGDEARLELAQESLVHSALHGPYLRSGHIWQSISLHPMAAQKYSMLHEPSGLHSRHVPGSSHASL